MLLLLAGLSTVSALQAPAYRAQRRVARAQVYASLMTAPPAPPPVNVFGGGDGGGGEPDEYLRLMDEEEMHSILEEWSGRSRIYRMSDDEWVQERHASGLATVDSIIQDKALETEGRRLSLGLFEDERVWAVAVAEVSVRNGLQVRSLAVHPSQLHVAESTAYQRMLHGLRRLAEEIEVKLDLQALRELQPLEELRQRLRSSDF